MLQISLKAARINADMTQSMVAKALKVTKSTIISWEKNRTYPTADNLKKLCELYKIPMDYIFLSNNPL